MPTRLARPAKEVIDQAIAENKSGERLLYVLSTASAAVGLFVLVWALLELQPVIALAGSICTALYWPAMRLARETRKENIALRLLEAPLSKAATASAAAEMLRENFLKVFSKDNEVSPQHIESGSRVARQGDPSA